MTDHHEIFNAVDEYLRKPVVPTTTHLHDSEFISLINGLTEFHLQNCKPYRQIVSQIFKGRLTGESLSDVPYIPIRLFKSMELRSVSSERIVKTMTSSGTSGLQPSRVFLDRETSSFQTRALSAIMGRLLGNQRLPLLIVDTDQVLKNNSTFSARGAAVIGFSMFGRHPKYALDTNLQLKKEVLTDFCSEHRDESVLVFGFTSVVWESLICELMQSNTTISIPHGILLHGGGWKRLIAKSVSNEEFTLRVRETTGIGKVVNYYGMVEQTGSIFVECQAGFLHSSPYSNVLVRHPVTLEPVSSGEPGLIQVVSALPCSYPGHSILTEDEGVIFGRADCRCGQPGTFFKVLGRIQNAEIRGCSDTPRRLMEQS